MEVQGEGIAPKLWEQKCLGGQWNVSRWLLQGWEAEEDKESMVLASETSSFDR